MSHTLQVFTENWSQSAFDTSDIVYPSALMVCATHHW